MTSFDVLHPRSEDSGRFTTTTHGDPGLTLGNTPDPEKVVTTVFDVIGTATGVGCHFVRERKQALAAGEMTTEEVFAEMAAINHGGSCQRHKGDNIGFTASYCEKCRIAMALEYIINPGPEPVPLGGPPRRGPRHSLRTGELLSEDWNEDLGTNTTTHAMTGDEKFEAAIRTMLGSPANAKVTVTDMTTESGDYTKDYDTRITVKAGRKSATFEGMGELMRKLDEKAEDGPVEMALRLMRATKARRPLLSGPAAIYRRHSHSSPKAEFAHITQVYSSGEQTIQVLYLDGRVDYISARTIVAITETDQTQTWDG